jgi:hypothetical protein
LAFGELIQVFVDIADNTRAAVVLLKEPSDDLGGKRDHGSEQKQSPQYRYDRNRWNALVEYDPELARVEATLQPYGQKYIDQLATAYLTLNDKNKLPDIIKKIIETAKRDSADAAAAEERRRNRFSDPAYVLQLAKEKFDHLASRPYGNIAVLKDGSALLLQSNGKVSEYSNAIGLRDAFNDREHWSDMTDESKIRFVRTIAAHIPN